MIFKNKIKEPYSLFSNLFFIFAVILSALLKEYLLSSLLLLQLVISTTYHAVKNKGLDWPSTKGKTAFQQAALYADTAVAAILFLGSFYYWYSNGFFVEGYLAFAVFLPALYILFFPVIEYDKNHALWHFLSALSFALLLMLPNL